MNTEMKLYSIVRSKKSQYEHGEAHEEAIYQAVEEFAYVEYNYSCPHSYDGYLTPHQARIA